MYICESHSFWRSLNIPWNPEDRSLTITTKTRHPGGGRTRRTFGWVFSRRLSGAAENLPKQLMSTIGSSKRFDIDRREKIAPPFSSPNGFPLEISSFPLAFSKSLRGLAPRRVVYTPSPVSEGSSPQVAIWKTQQMTQSFLEDDVPILWAGYIYIYLYLMLRWWFHIFRIFTPGEIYPIWLQIFQVWNHQLVVSWSFFEGSRSQGKGSADDICWWMLNTGW